MKRLSIFIIALVTLMLTGCGESSTSIIEKYLEKTYDTEFEFITTINSSPIPFAKQNIVTAQFRCDKYNDKIVTASYNKEKKEISDNIPVLEYYDSIDSIVVSTLSYAGIQKYEMEQRVTDGVIQRDKDYTYEDYLREWQWKNIVVITEQEITQDIVDDIIDYLKQQDISINIRLAQIDNYNNIDYDNGLWNSSATKYIIRAVNIDANAVDNTFEYKW